MFRSCFSGMLATAVVAAGLLCQGCGRGEYERRMEEYLNSLGAGGTVKLFDPFTLNEIQGKQIRVQVPLAFKDAPYTPDSPVTEARKKIPFVDLSGHERTYEGFVVAEDGSKTPYYCYLAATDLSRGSRSQERILGQMKRALTTFSESATTDGQKFFAKADGSQSEWSYWRASGPMDFIKLTQDGQEEKVRAEGTLEVFGQIHDNMLLLVAWRYPRSLADFQSEDFPGIDALEKAVAAHITIQGKE